ncbi:MAG: TonB family protein [Saprospiraceae bacterium]|nr:TonB family protein [Saprospiraceae bacterium]
MTLILYLLQVTCCLAFFYGFYHLILRKETLFETNRFYLVTTLAASIVLPLIKIYIESLPSDPAVLMAPVAYVGSYVDALTIDIAVSQNTPFPWDRLIMGIYFLGVAVMSVRLLYAVRDIHRIRQHGTKTMVEDHYCILSEKVKSPFSFFSSIYFPKHHQFDESELREIVVHELAHVKGRHTLDILLMEAACILLWPSPLIYLYRKALKDVHEFVADAAVIRDTPWEHYAQLLVGQQQGQLQNILSNQLIYSQLKKRLVMMNQERSGFAARFKYLGIIPVVLIAMIFFSFREKPILTKNLVLSENIAQVTDTVILFLKEDKRIFIGSQEITKDEIELKMTEATKNMPDPIVIVLLENPNSATVGELADIMQIGAKMHMSWIGYLDDEGKFDTYKSLIKERDFVFTSLASLGADKKMKPYAYVEEMPRYNGCEDILDPSERFKCTMGKLFEFVYETIQYPAEDKANRIEGHGIVQFVVEADGSLSDIRVLRSPSPTIAAEMMRMMNVMAAITDAWLPGKHNGVTVPVTFTLPVKFKLQDEQQIGAIELKAAVDVSNSTIKVIPNPAQESITVTIFKDTHTLKIFDTAGKLILTQKVTSSSANNQTINIVALRPGQYFVQVISDKESLSAAFAVVK